MKIACLDHKGLPAGEWAGRAAEILKENGYRVELQIISPQEQGGRIDLRGKGIDLFVTFDLQGFEQGTLLGNVSYNLFDCKQVHILTKERLSNEKYLEKQLSISMFFFCVGEKYYGDLMQRYPDIPYLEELKDWEKSGEAKALESNAKCLAGVLMKVAEICHIKKE